MAACRSAIEHAELHGMIADWSPLRPALLRLALASLLQPRLAAWAESADLPGDVVELVGPKVEKRYENVCLMRELHENARKLQGPPEFDLG
jgi:hypothetical protein